MLQAKRHWQFFLLLFVASMRGKHGFLFGPTNHWSGTVDKNNAISALTLSRPETPAFPRNAIITIRHAGHTLSCSNSGGEHTRAFSSQPNKSEPGMFGKIFVHLGNLFMAVGAIFWTTICQAVGKLLAAKVFWLIRTTDHLKTALLDSRQPLSSPNPQVIRLDLNSIFDS